MIKGAIFDLDGTLLDSMQIWEHAAEDYLVSVGRIPKEGVCDAVKNMTMLQAGEYLRAEYSITAPVGEIADGINAVIKDFYVNRVQLKKYAMELLEYLSGIGVKMCAATATDRHLVQAALKRCGADGFFSRIFTCTEEASGKDRPVIFRKALDFLQTDKDETAVFEDALYAIKTAKRDGFKVAAVFDASEPEQEQIKELADIYLRDLRVCETIKKFVCGV